MPAKEPLLRSAATWLLGEGSQGEGLCDLSNWLCVLRGRRAGRLLLHELVETARTLGRGLIPPRVLTQGDMARELLEGSAPTAQPVERTLAWMQALKSLSPGEIKPLVPVLPAKEDWSAWHRLARTVDSLHEELAGAGKEMRDAAAIARAMCADDEGERWEVLAAALQRYRVLLHEAGLVDPHEVRWAAMREGRRSVNAWNIALIGVPELNPVQRAALAMTTGRVVALVHADEELRDGFDDHGCVRSEFWEVREIPLGNASVRLADRSSDQAQEVMHALADIDGKHAVEELILGVGDDALRSEVARAAMWAGVEVHDSEGQALARTPAGRLLAAAADFLEDSRFAHFASLVRHAGLADWLKRVSPGDDNARADWLSLLDCYFADHLQQWCADDWLGEPKRAAALKRVYSKVNEWLAPLAGGAKPLADWLARIAAVLCTIYPDAVLEHSRDERSGAAALLEACIPVAAAPLALQPNLTPAETIRLLLREVGAAPMPAEPRRNAIEMLGWLELHPDPAAVVIVAGVNDGCIPATTTPDPFLPDTLRAKLGLACNRSRYARDAYLLDTMLRSGQRVTLISGRRSPDGEPLTPSRLLLACSESELPSRVRQLFHDPPPPGLPLGTPAPREESLFVVPALPSEFEPLAYLRVTDFKLFLACPYRFALERMLRLKDVTDRVFEMDAPAFGSMAHEVLADFGRCEELRDETDSDRIAESLIENLRAMVRRRYGATPLPAVQVQAAQLEQRMLSFAQFQAASRREGWRIAHVEHALDDSAALEIPGDAAMPIHGKIDRIDQHEHTKAWRIIDYKTGDSGTGPVAAHHDGRTKLPDVADIVWTDLQLPLYRDLAARSDINVNGEVELGFIVLPRQTDGAAWKCAEWSAAHLDSAIECAREVVRRIRAGQFERNVRYAARFDRFGRICQSMVLTSAEDFEVEEALL